MITEIMEIDSLNIPLYESAKRLYSRISADEMLSVSSENITDFRVTETNVSGKAGENSNFILDVKDGENLSAATYKIAGSSNAKNLGSSWKIEFDTTQFEDGKKLSEEDIDKLDQIVREKMIEQQNILKQLSSKGKK